jgi:hypothetical protein
MRLHELACNPTPETRNLAAHHQGTASGTSSSTTCSDETRKATGCSGSLDSMDRASNLASAALRGRAYREIALKSGHFALYLKHRDLTSLVRHFG